MIGTVWRCESTSHFQTLSLSPPNTYLCLPLPELWAVSIETFTTLVTTTASQQSFAPVFPLHLPITSSLCLLFHLFLPSHFP